VFRVGGAGEPAGAAAHLRRHRGDVVRMGHAPSRPGRRARASALWQHAAGPGGHPLRKRARSGPLPAPALESSTGSGRGSPRRGSPPGRCSAAPPRRWCAR
jgi:hypothetical protein